MLHYICHVIGTTDVLDSVLFSSKKHSVEYYFGRAKTMVIDEIVEKRKETYKEIIRKYPIDSTELHLDDGNSFIDSFRSGFVSILQCQNPSHNRGEDVEYNYLDISTMYENAGGKCISIYTEPFFYEGSDEHLIQIKKNTRIPLLRMDFIFDEYQIYESKMIGANAVQLISSIISYDELRYFINVSHRIGIGCMVNCKNADEINRAFTAGAKIIGVSGKNAIDYSLDFVKKMREKGNELFLVLTNDKYIRSVNDVKKYKNIGFDGVLIGEYVFKSKNPEKLINEIVNI